MTMSTEGQPTQLSLLRQARSLLAARGLRPQKRLGQNFLVDASVLESIVAAAELSPQDTVIEVGPGLGFLTRELVGRAGRVIAVELDVQLAAILRDATAGSPVLRVVLGDILHLDPAELVAGGERTVAPTLPATYKLVANLPYYITSPVLRHFLEARVKPGLMVVMVQKEVAQRICAQPPDLSLLGVSVQVYGHPRIVRVVPAGAFFPRPEVDSALVRIDVYPRPAVNVDDLDQFFRLVAAGFSQPRKQIHNTLAQRLWFPPGGAKELLERMDIDPRRRAETLSLEDWERLYHGWRGEDSTSA